MPLPLHLPPSYSPTPPLYTTLLLSHHPPSSPSPTPIIILTLHRPDAHNAFTDTMMEELEHAFGLLGADDRVKCVVVTGHGRMFCAGADLKVGLGLGGAEGEGRGHRDGGGRAALAIHHCPKPTILALNGPAVGVGITLTLPMTIRFAVRTAKIGFVFARRGIAMEACSSFFLPRLIGYGRAMHVVTTGEVYRADDGVLEGLFTGFAETKEECLGLALGAAEGVVAQCSVVSVVLMREMMWRGLGSAEETHLLDSRVLAGLRASVDNDEGVKAFMEKRPAKFTGTLEKNAPEVYPWWTPVDTSVKAKIPSSALEKGKL